MNRRDLLIAASLANVCLLNVWLSLLDTPFNGYHRSGQPRVVDLVASIACLLLLTIAFWVPVALLRRRHSRFGLSVARALFVAALIIPGNAVRVHLFSVHDLLRNAGKGGAAVLFVLAALVGVLAAFYWRRKVVHGIATFVLWLFPFVLVTTIQAGSITLKGGAPPPRHGPIVGAGSSSARVPASRVVCVVFDELDERLLFAERPSSLSLPEFDRLHAHAFRAMNAYPPADDTLRSLPSITAGMLVAKAAPEGAGRLTVTLRSDGSTLSWSALPSVFSHAREMGASTALLGWYHPYDRIFGGHVDMCVWEPLNLLHRVGEPSFVATTGRQLHSLSPTAERFHHVWRTERLVTRTQSAVSSKDFDLVFAHLPIPHLPAIYARAAEKLTIWNWGPDWGPDGYLANLVLVDRVLGQIRRAMEASGVWENTAVLVTSDHWWRGSAKFDGKTDQRVPFLLKLPGHGDASVYETQFNTVVTHDLLLLLLQGQLRTGRQVASWLDHQVAENPEAVYQP